MKPLLSILICTVPERREQFIELWTKLSVQAAQFGGKVEVKYRNDPKATEPNGMNVGRKRQLLIEEAQGEYIVFFDDDDEPYHNYVSSIVSALETKPDCVGMVIQMTTDGRNPQLCHHSRVNRVWRNGRPKDKYHYYRNVTHFNPVRRDFALQAGFKAIPFGEDEDYASRLTPLCKTEVMIWDPIWHYRYTTTQDHKKKYGIE